MFQRMTVAGLLAGLCLAASAQTAGTKVSHKVGDVVVMQVEMRADNRITEETITVVAVEGNLIRSRHVRPDRNPPDLEGILTDEHALALSGASGARYDPPIPLVKLPAAVGSTWKASYNMVTPNQARSRGETDLKVVAEEKLKTPGGEFDTFKIEQAGWVNGVSWNGSVRTTQTLWFAPAIGRVVRSEFRSFRGGQPWEHTVMELKSFKPGP